MTHLQARLYFVFAQTPQIEVQCLQILQCPPVESENCVLKQSPLHSYNGDQCRAPSGTGCYGIDKNDYWVFTGGDLEGSCLTPSGPSPGPLPGGSRGGDKLKRNMQKGIRFA